MCGPHLTNLEKSADLQLIHLHEHLVQHLLLETEQCNSIEGRVTNDSGAVKGADLELLRVTRKSVEAFVREMADLGRQSDSNEERYGRTILVHSHERILGVHHLNGT